MSTDNFHQLPLEDYLQRGAGKARRALHKEAFSRRIEHWQFSNRATALEEAKATIMAQFGTELAGLQQAVAEAQLQYDVQLEIVLSFERQMAQARKETVSEILGGLVLSTSCTLAKYEVALHLAKKHLRQAQAILEDRQEQTEACYAELLAMDAVVQLRETVRQKLEERRAREARAFSARVGVTPSGKLRAEILGADLGEYEKGLLQAIGTQENFARSAAFFARGMAKQLNAGKSSYVDEAPREAHRFKAHGPYVRALDRQGRTVALWAVASDGSAYLIKVLQPAGTRRIRRRGHEVQAIGKKGDVLAGFPATAWLTGNPANGPAMGLAA